MDISTSLGMFVLDADLSHAAQCNGEKSREWRLPESLSTTRTMSMLSEIRAVTAIDTKELQSDE
jgi:hypothetical protein